MRQYISALPDELIQAARIDPAPMVSFMRKMSRDDGQETPDTLRYLSTHPQTGARVETLDRLAKAASYEPITLLTGEEWQALRSICRSGAEEAEPSREETRR